MAVGRELNAHRRARRRLIERLRLGGIHEIEILHAFDAVPRHLFVPEALLHRAYEDVALPIGFGQTISRPSVHALHLRLVRPLEGRRVLEVGTGSGFQSALLATLGAEVFSVEVVAQLAERAEERIERLGLSARIRHGDGRAGWPEAGPFEAILIGAAGRRVPGALLAQLADGGRLLAPVGEGERQRLVRVVRRGDALDRETIEDARFVPLVELRTEEGRGGAG